MTDKQIAVKVDEMNIWFHQQTFATIDIGSGNFECIELSPGNLDLGIPVFSKLASLRSVPIARENEWHEKLWTTRNILNETLHTYNTIYVNYLEIKSKLAFI